uniref:Uncharacterized protein n=1 Tax=Streptomyces sp. NBC_00008 TaxID=2903610 RepID=A0AAU2VVB3_9ACTN
MGFAGEEAAAPGLRVAVDFYSEKADQLSRREKELEEELDSVREERSRTLVTRDQLSVALAEISAQAGPQPAEPAGEENPAEAESASGQGSKPSRAGAEETPPRPGRRSENASGPQRRSASGELMRAIEQVLTTAGVPLHLKELTAALGRPTEGKPGTAALESVRSTCKRLVETGRLVQPETAVFAIAPGRRKGASSG